MKLLTDIYTLPTGFQSAAIHAGVKKDPAKLDMTLILSESPSALAGVFTLNKVKAAPVKWCTHQVARGQGRAIIANSGNANACTGERGDADAKAMAVHTANALGIAPEEVSICSTGCIGIPLPMPTINAGIDRLVPALSSDDVTGPHGILTSDSREKVVTVELAIDGKAITVTAMAKGAGMIEPNMATMLCFILTDAAVEADALQTALAHATQESFNRISVDGDMSTNDTVLVLANGEAGNTPITPTHPAWPLFQQCLNELTLDLALKIVADGEGTTKVITLHVNGAASDQEADIAARRIANSLLVKTAWAGDYPVWGRIMDVLGYTDITLEEHKIDIHIGDLQVTRQGLDGGASNEQVLGITSQPVYTITIDLGIGPGRSYLYTTDCTEEYVRLNMV